MTSQIASRKSHGLVGLSLLALGLGLVPALGGAVTNGTTIPPDQLAPGGAYEWLVRLESGLAQCTGTLIAPEYVLTAAHCLDSGIPAVHVGGATIGVSQAHVHPNWIGTTEFDVALLHLVAPSPARPLTMASQAGLVAAGDMIQVAGWGTTSGEAAPAEGSMRVAQSSPTSLYAVADPASVCNGDSGGPVLLGQPGVDAALVGVAVANPSGVCSDMLAIPVSLIANWIQEVTSANVSGPLALSGSLTTTMDTPVQIPIEFSDPSGASLTLADITSSDSTNGTITACASEIPPTTCTFQPAPGFLGTATFTYTVNSGGRTATALWTIDVVQDTGPKVRLESATFSEPLHGRTRVTVELLLDQPLSTPVIVTLVPRDGGATSGLDYIAKPAEIEFRPGQTRAFYSFFLLADKTKESVEGFDLVLSAVGATAVQPEVSMFIDRNGPNDPPVVLSGTLTAISGQTIDITLDFYDPDGPALTVDAIQSITMTHMEFIGCNTFSETGVPLICSFALEPGFVGTATLTYTVTDGIDTAVGEWAIEVLPGA